MKNATPPQKKTAMQNRRYYLHQKLRKAGYSYIPADRTISIPFSQVDTPPSAAIELRDRFHYSLQLVID